MERRRGRREKKESDRQRMEEGKEVEGEGKR